MATGSKLKKEMMPHPVISRHLRDSEGVESMVSKNGGGPVALDPEVGMARDCCYGLW